MSSQEQSRSEFFSLFSSSTLRKIGGLALIAGCLLEANAVTHFSETAFSAQGVEALVLGGVALKTGTNALNEAHRQQMSNDDAFNSSTQD